MAFEVVMPHMGEGVIEGTVSRWLKAEGEPVALYEPILEIETDKVTTEATSENEGILLQILVSEGETVPVGTVLAYIGQADESVPPGATPATLPAAAHANGQSHPAPVEIEPPLRQGVGRISPVVSRIAAEHRVDLMKVPGTGRDGRITKKDILAYVTTRESAAATVPAAAPAPEPPAAKPQPVAPAPPPTSVAPPAPAPTYTPPTVSTTPLGAELIPHSNMRRSIAEHMVRSKHTSPHVTTVFEVDFSQVAAHRAAHKATFARDNANLTFTAYIISALVEALKAHPRVNSSWTDEGLLLRRDINIGMAAAIEGGLIVPVIKHADSLNLLGLARAINDLTERARNKQLRPDDVQGGTFSLTNHGTSGSLFATPIINQPQCGILGVGKIEKRVKVINDAIAIRPLAYVSFTFDHRILDGASADAFVSTFKDLIEGWQ
ncbi:MAG: 2-oxo acid dehydrogenase subunit E2 [Ardenticatenales bacterium]|nr:2-oxo acid dehydrogenase subunit E2 [Ardenticatenales bacterium]